MELVMLAWQVNVWQTTHYEKLMFSDDIHLKETDTLSKEGPGRWRMGRILKWFDNKGQSKSIFSPMNISSVIPVTRCPSHEVLHDRFWVKLPELNLQCPLTQYIFINYTGYNYYGYNSIIIYIYYIFISDIV